MNKKILIIDDELNILRSLEMILNSEGFTVFKAANLKEAKKVISKENIFLYLVDVILPDGDGIDFIKHIRERKPEAIIIMISGHASIKMAIDATRKSADDFLEKPLSKEKLLLTLNNFLKRLELEEKYADLKKTTLSGELIGHSQAMQEILKQVDKIAPTNSKILITGESGTGKEIVARMIHFKSKRNNKPYIKINCAAIPEELIEAELFGAEKGAYTGSTERRDGKFKLADRGTLFLDEIGDMSLTTQTKVLRVLQEGELERVGGSETITTDVRIIAATNKDLKQLVNEGLFREDLYFRLHVVPLHIPPLRERKEDIILMVNHFLNIFSRENNRPKMTIKDNAMQKLISYDWPGNVRELKNIIERLVIMTDGETIDMEQLPSNFLVPDFDVSDTFSQQKSLREFRDQIESQYIKYCLDKFDGNIARTGEFLQVERTYFYKKLKKMGLRE
jgi:two-component system nitrogen regulation response regulator NtrX